MTEFKSTLVDKLNELSNLIAIATRDVRDLQQKLAYEQQRVIERRREIAAENALLQSNVPAQRPPANDA